MAGLSFLSLTEALPGVGQNNQERSQQGYEKRQQPPGDVGIQRHPAGAQEKNRQECHANQAQDNQNTHGFASEKHPVIIVQD